MQHKKQYRWFARAISALLLLPYTVALAQDQTRDQVPLIQPLDDEQQSLQSSPDIFIEYFNVSRGWLFNVAVGFAVLWILVGGVMFILSGNNQSRRGEAISRITWAVVGLIILLFAGVILRTLNSIFFIR